MDEFAPSSDITKGKILRKATALFDVVAAAILEKKRFGILDQYKQRPAETVGI